MPRRSRRVPWYRNTFTLVMAGLLIGCVVYGVILAMSGGTDACT
jgi:hypothetical protein